MAGVTTLPARSARKPKGEGHSRRAEILAAAERIFVECGYEGATIRKIAEEVGLSSTALYMHFSEKSEILLEICRNAFEQLARNHHAIYSQDAPPEVRIRRMLEAYITFGFEHPNAYRLIYMTRPAEAREAAEDAAMVQGAELFVSFQSLLEQVAAEGRLKRDTTAAAQCLWAGAHGIVSLVITKPYFDWTDRPLFVDTMLDSLFEGMIRS
ncbi:MAG: TetR/AcrR family transcriptional regulator [Brevundimonas sp.]|uniref:TetR/AcrR family transcriptional regulator n=1 Tax=Brevundimonas sp. Leaf363 TaxID=1736353 RepID=UPI0006F9F448|nr:TetR/AcrR family transcriptional regulator [Brevundimonas sp. Leaf363]KQS56173.1 TetR family transcriptional regulator [Brevundimonas sp. Leaf363]RZJ89595.1 MAG: TetR/AcrR family transcriptional regulator [Brevundimonas sp.]